MKKRIVSFAAMAAALTLMTGCASQAGAETAASAGTAAVAETDNAAETGGAAETAGAAEKTEAVSGTEAAAEAAGTEGQDGDIDASVLVFPVRVWGAITSVSEAEGDITVDNQSKVSYEGEIVFHIDPESTLVLDAVSGLPVALADVEKGSFEAYLGPVMTMSLPPQTTPELVIVNIPQDFEAPRYVTAGGELKTTEKGRVLTAVDGTEYLLAEDMQISPYLTKNIVMPEDIHEGSRCLLWMNGDGEAERIVLFGE